MASAISTGAKNWLACARRLSSSYSSCRPTFAPGSAPPPKWVRPPAWLRFRLIEFPLGFVGSARYTTATSPREDASGRSSESSSAGPAALAGPGCRSRLGHRGGHRHGLLPQAQRGGVLPVPLDELHKQGDGQDGRGDS